jgi:hypothetical protein
MSVYCKGLILAYIGKQVPGQVEGIQLIPEHLGIRGTHISCIAKVSKVHYLSTE